MDKVDNINLSPSFLSKVLSKGYDYAVAEKMGFIIQETPSMNAGKVIHSMLSGKYGGKEDKIVISPYNNFRTKESQNWRDSQEAIIISKKDSVLYENIVERVVNHPEVKKILDGAEVKAEEKVTKEVNGFNVKGILDIVAIKNNVKDIIDWKFVSSQVFDDFGRKALWQHYDLQAGVYDFLTDATHVYFVAIENQAPYRIKVLHCDPSFMESGADKFSKALTILKKENWRYPSFDIQGVDDLVAWGY